MIKPELRHDKLGASEIPALMGWDPWGGTPMGLYLRKNGLAEPMTPTFRMRRGKWMERLLIEEEYPAITGRKVRYSDESRYDPERPWMVCTPDGLCEEEPRGVEAKVVAWDQRAMWDNGPPPHVYLQCAWSMEFFGFDRWDVISAIGDSDPEVSTIERDQELIDVIRDRAMEFYHHHLLPQTPPPVDGSAATTVWLQRRFPRQRLDVRPATEAEIRLLEEYARVRAEQGAVAGRRKLLENQLREAVGDHEGIAWDAGRFLWRKQRDSVKIQWESMARGLMNNFLRTAGERETLQALYEHIKPGGRRIRWEYKGALVEDTEAA